MALAFWNVRSLTRDPHMEIVGIIVGFVFCLILSFCAGAEHRRWRDKLKNKRKDAEEAVQRDVEKLKRVFGDKFLNDRGRYFALDRMYRHQLDHEETDLPPLISLAAEAHAKHPDLKRTPEELALWLYYLCGGAEGARKRLEWVIQQDELMPKFLEELRNDVLMNTPVVTQ